MIIPSQSTASRPLLRRAGIALFATLPLTSAVLALALSTPATASAATTDTVIEDGYLTVSDGTRLRYHLERPAVSATFPVLLQYDGYSAGTGPDFGSMPAFKERMLPQGYAFLGVSIRGTGCSGGRFDFFEPQEAADGVDIIAWAARQPWSNGKVGMMGYSFPGVMQLLTAGKQPAALKAIAPMSLVADLYRDVTYPGGLPNSVFQFMFTGQQRYPSFTAVPEAVLATDAECAANFAASQALSPALGVQLTTNPYIDDPLNYPARSGITNASSVSVPALLLTYWQDEQTGSRNAGGWEPGGLMTKLNPNTTWATFGNANHDYTPNNGYQLQLMQQFFEYYLGGKKNNWPSTPRVSVMHENKLSTGAASWITTYPGRPATTTTSFYLGTRGLLSTALPAPSLGLGDSFTYPLPSASTNPQPGTSELNDTWSAAGPDDGRVVYTTPALSKDVTTFGSASADLWLRSTALDTDLQVTLTEVRPDGTEVYVQRGWLRASARKLDAGLSTPTRPLITGRRADAAALTPGAPMSMRVEIAPFGHTFRKGSSIRLIVDAPTGITGNWGFNYNPTPSVTTILYGTSYPSRLVLGIVRGETSGGRPAPACGDLIYQPCRAAIGTVPLGLLQIE